VETGSVTPSTTAPATSGDPSTSTPGDPALPATGSGDRAGVLLALGALLVAGGAAVLALSQRRTPGRHAA
jgi:LPXTG-motif cell wall-anchored protein